jgi:hypothetical protein
MFAAFVGIAAKTGDDFTILRAFTSLSLLSILNNPLALLLSSLPSLAAIMSSFARIQDYLNRKTRDDSRALEAAANILSKDTYPGLPTPTGLEMQTINHESESAFRKALVPVVWALASGNCLTEIFFLWVGALLPSRRIRGASCCDEDTPHSYAGWRALGVACCGNVDFAHLA